MGEEKSRGVMVRLSPEQVRRVDDWRREQPDLPTRPEAIRRLMEMGLGKPEPQRRKRFRLHKPDQEGG